MHWAFWLRGRQSDVLGFVVSVAVSLIRWSSWSCDRQSDALGFVVMWPSV